MTRLRSEAKGDLFVAAECIYSLYHPDVNDDCDRDYVRAMVGAMLLAEQARNTEQLVKAWSK